MTFRPATALELQPFRDAYRNEAGCQIVHDSAIERGFADAYLAVQDNKVIAYGAVWNKIYPGRLMEFWTTPDHRPHALQLCKALIATARATHLEAQTNMPLMFGLLNELGETPEEQYILFEDARATSHAAPGATFRPRHPADEGKIFEHHHEPVGDWVIELEGQVVATGGYFCHYNPPYADIFMEVHEPHRRKGLGSFLVQELKRIARQTGKTPAARCNPNNIASQNTLQRAGFVPCGKMLAARIAAKNLDV